MPARFPIDRLPDQAIHQIPLGDLDALVANLGAPTQPPALNQLLTNDGHAFFADFTATSLSLPVRPSEAIALGDIDGDGDLDAVTANPNSPNQLLINDGTGHFTPTDLTSALFRTVDIALGDVNGDGHLDVLFVTAGQGTQLQINNGNGGFNSPITLVAGGAPPSSAIALGDINGDGFLDAVIANSNASTLAPNQVLINDGTGNFTAISLPTLSPSNKSTDVALGDVDGDGHLDILFATDGQGTQLLLNGTGPFILPGGSPPSRGIALGDVDGDGDLDALVANLNAHNQLLTNDGTGHFTSTDLPGDPQPSVDIVLGDVDRDGDLDALVANLNAPNQLLINDGTGHFDDPINLPGGPQPSHAIALGDIDGDGLIPPVDDHGLPNINTLGLLPDLFV